MTLWANSLNKGKWMIEKAKHNFPIYQPSNQELVATSRMDMYGLVLQNLISPVPVSSYLPKRREMPPRILPVPTAWKGIESILGDLLEVFNVGGKRCLEFGVDFGYSTAALSCFFDEVTGVDLFMGDTEDRRDIFAQTSKRLAGFSNIRLVRDDYRNWIAQDNTSYDLIHIDIDHTYKDTFIGGLWSARHAPCVFFHDTLSFLAVRRAVSAIARLTGKRFYNFKESHGLGILV